MYVQKLKLSVSLSALLFFLLHVPQLCVVLYNKQLTRLDNLIN